MNMLARREHSFHELLDKLTLKYPDLSPDADILPVVQRLRDQSLQSDSRFVDAFVRYRSTRGVGPQKIAAELYSRKLDQDLQQQALYNSDIDWEASCLDVLSRKFKPTGRVDMQQKQRWQRFLLQRGFAHEHVSAAIKTLSKQGSGVDEY